MFWLTASVMPAARHASTHFAGLRDTIMRQRFLGEDAADVVVVLAGRAEDGRLGVRRHGDVEHLDLGIGEQFVDGGVTARDAVLLRRPPGVRWRPRGDGDRIEPGLAVGDQMAVAHDEAGADAADAKVLAARQTRQIV